jgi:hypothetical protein
MQSNLEELELHSFLPCTYIGQDISVKEGKRNLGQIEWVVKRFGQAFDEKTQ